MSLPELVQNIFQIAVFAILSIVSFLISINRTNVKSTRYFTGATFCYVFGNIFWTLYFVINGYFPYYFSAADVSYIGLYIFLISLAVMLRREYSSMQITKRMRIIGLLCSLWVMIANGICYFMVGGFLWTLMYAIPLAIMGYYAIINVIIFKNDNNNKFIYKANITLVLFVFFDNMMFLVSSFGFNNLYIIFDFLTTLTFPAMLYFLSKEKKE